ncbi:MAG TPA: hypothetical protein PLL06_12440 [Acidobacteriota bacterium]|nr:hypothetical protein [Acidobacteriota bacterium]
MRLAKTDRCQIDEQEILAAQLDLQTFSPLFPVELEEVHPLSVPASPCLGGLIQLDNGQYLFLYYCFPLTCASVLKPVGQPTREVLAHLFQEVPDLRDFVTFIEAH